MAEDDTPQLTPRELRMVRKLIRVYETMTAQAAELREPKGEPVKIDPDIAAEIMERRRRRGA